MAIAVCIQYTRWYDIYSQKYSGFCYIHFELSINFELFKLIFYVVYAKQCCKSEKYLK